MISEVVGTLLNFYSEHFSSFCEPYLILIRQPSNRDWQVWFRTKAEFSSRADGHLELRLSYRQGQIIIKNQGRISVLFV